MRHLRHLPGSNVSIVVFQRERKKRKKEKENQIRMQTEALGPAQRSAAQLSPAQHSTVLCVIALRDTIAQTSRRLHVRAAVLYVMSFVRSHSNTTNMHASICCFKCLGRLTSFCFCPYFSFSGSIREMVLYFFIFFFFSPLICMTVFVIQHIPPTNHLQQLLSALLA